MQARKKRSGNQKSNAPIVVLRQPVPKVERDAKRLAKSHLELAIETLATIAREGANDAARVTAARALLDHAFGRPAVQAQEYKGKKEAAAREAETAGSGSEWGNDLQAPPAKAN
jgi:hypothetical protein